MYFRTGMLKKSYFLPLYVLNLNIVIQYFLQLIILLLAILHMEFLTKINNGNIMTNTLF